MTEVRPHLIDCCLAIFCVCSLLPLVCCLSSHKKEDSSISFVNGFLQAELSNGIDVVVKRREAKGAAVAIAFQRGNLAFVDSESDIELLALNSVFKRTGIDNVDVSVTDDYSICCIECEEQEASGALYSLVTSLYEPSKYEKAPSAIGIKTKSEQEQFISAVRCALFNEQNESQHVISTEEMSLFNASRIIVVAAGQFSETDATAFVVRSESLLKNISQLTFDSPAAFPPNIKNGITVLPLAANGYMAGCFSVPHYSSDDYVSFALATMYFDDVLRHNIVEMNTVAFAAGIALLGGNTAVGVISIVGAKDSDAVLQSMLDSIGRFPDESGVEILLSSKKRRYMAQLRSRAALAASECRCIVESIIYLGAADLYTKRAAIVSGVTAEHICSAFDKYIVKNEIHWYVCK